MIRNLKTTVTILSFVGMTILTTFVLRGDNNPMEKLSRNTIFSFSDPMRQRNKGVALVTVSYGHEASNPYSTYSMQNKRRFCELTGCTFMPQLSLTDPAVNPSWEKIPGALRALSKFDIVWVLDLDAIIMDGNFTVRDVMQGDTKRNVFTAEDCNGITSGSFILRNSTWTIKYLQALWYYRHQEKKSEFEEQYAMMSFYEQNLLNSMENYRLVSQESLNMHPKEIGCNINGDYEIGNHPILHFMSCIPRKLCDDLFLQYSKHSWVN